MTIHQMPVGTAIELSTTPFKNKIVQLLKPSSVPQKPKFNQVCSNPMHRPPHFLLKIHQASFDMLRQYGKIEKTK